VATKTKNSYPDHASELKRINRVIGQLEGIKRMIEEKRYCPDILMQTRAISAALRSLETEILDKHLHCCVMAAIKSGDRKEADSKMKELLDLFQKRG